MKHLLVAAAMTAGMWLASLRYKPIESLLFVPITFLSVVFPVLSVYHRDRPSEMLGAVLWSSRLRRRSARARCRRGMRIRSMASS